MAEREDKPNDVESVGPGSGGLQWAEPTPVRARGYRARRWMGALGLLAVVLVFGLAGATVWEAIGAQRPAAKPAAGVQGTTPTSGEPTSGPTSTPTSGPSPTADVVPVSAMLRPVDLGSDWRVETEQLKGDLGLGLIGRVCWNELATPSFEHVVGFRTRGLTDRPEAVTPAENDPYHSVGVEATAYDKGWATVAMAEWLADTKKPCTYDGMTQTLTAIDTDFEGNGSLLMRYADSGGYQRYFALVRRGEVVVMIHVSPLLDRNLLRRSAHAAFERLCAVTQC